MGIRPKTRQLSIVSLLTLGVLAAFQNCGKFNSISEAASTGGTLKFRTSAVATAGNWPEGFGAALEAPLYNPHGPLSNLLRNGADDAVAMGIRTFKIHMSLGMLGANNNNFYRISDPALGSVKSLVDLAKISDFDYVLSRPFKTIFIDADNIGTVGRTNNYWNFDSVRMQAVDKQAVYDETYQFAKYLLTRFSNEDRIFVIQNHEGDSHTTPDAHPHGVPTDIGLANFKDYWQIRQMAIEKARVDVSSNARIYHMCEIVKVAKYLENPTHPTEGKSLLRDVLPQVACDLVGYSAHDTAIRGDGGVLFYKAIPKIRELAKASPTFPGNNLVLSEIAVPELPGTYGNFKPLTPAVAGWIAQLLQQGIPYILYWQLYDNDGIGNYLRRRDGSLSYMHEQLSQRFNGNSFPSSMKPGYNTPTTVAGINSGGSSGSGGTASTGTSVQQSCSFNGATIPSGGQVSAYAGASVPAGSSCVAQVRTCTNGTLSGSYTYAACTVQAPAAASGGGSGSGTGTTQCTDERRISPSGTVPLGVHPGIKQMYDEVLGGIGPYLAGAQYLTTLHNRGYTLQSLRSDLVREMVVQTELNKLYQHYLKRNIAAADMNNVRTFLTQGGTMRQLELQIVASPECRR